MRYTNVFCGCYELESGTRLIAWFYIGLYVFNIFLNIFAVDIADSYKETVDDELQYDEQNMLSFHYICLTFGIITILLSIAVLVKLSSQSEYFLKFIVKWNVFRCVFLFAGIIYVCAKMSHILTVAISCVVPVIDLCVSIYFTGVMASLVKVIEDPNGQSSPVNVLVDAPSAGPSCTNSSPVTDKNDKGMVNPAIEPELELKASDSAPKTEDSQNSASNRSEITIQLSYPNRLKEQPQEIKVGDDIEKEDGKKAADMAAPSDASASPRESDGSEVRRPETEHSEKLQEQQQQGKVPTENDPELTPTDREYDGASKETDAGVTNSVDPDGDTNQSEDTSAVQAGREHGMENPGADTDDSDQPASAAVSL